MKIFLTGKNGQVGVELQRVRLSERNRGGRSSGMQSCRCVCNSSLGERDTAQGHRQSGGLYGCGRGRDCAAPGVDHQRRGARHFQRGSGAHRCSRRATTFSMAARTAATPRERGPIRSESTARPSLPANRRCPPAARNPGLAYQLAVGAHGANFAKTRLRLAAERHGLKEFAAPTFAALIADVAAQNLDQYAQKCRPASADVRCRSKGQVARREHP